MCFIVKEMEHASNSATNRNHSVHTTRTHISNSSRCPQQMSKESKLDRVALKKLLLASSVCLVFMVGEIVGGLLANSLAIATDAAHLLTDLTSFIISMVSIYLAARPSSQKLNWGWHRSEVLGALVSIIFIWIVTGVLVYMAIERLIYNSYDIDASIMLITAAVGLAFNILMGFILHSGGHGHAGHSHHGHSHEHTEPDDVDLLGQRGMSESINNDDTAELLAEKSPDSDDDLLSVNLESEVNHSEGPQRTNINIRAAFIHVLGDVLQSIGVLVASYIIYYKPEWKFVDPACTFVFSILVICTTIPILKDSVIVLMEGTPQGLSSEKIQSGIESLAGVREVHGLRVWSLTLDITALSVHLVLNEMTDRNAHQRTLSEIQHLLKKTYDINDCTIQIEYHSDHIAQPSRS